MIAASSSHPGPTSHRDGRWETWAPPDVLITGTFCQSASQPDLNRLQHGNEFERLEIQCYRQSYQWKIVHLCSGKLRKLDFRKVIYHYDGNLIPHTLLLKSKLIPHTLLLETKLIPHTSHLTVGVQARLEQLANPPLPSALFIKTESYHNERKK